MATESIELRAASASSSRAYWRSIWLKVHRWIGLALLPVFALLGLTGALLTWPNHFDRLVHPERYPADASASLAAPSALLRAAAAALPPGDAVSAIRYPEGITAVRVAGQVNGPPPLGIGPPSRAVVWLDPEDATVLSRTDRGGGFLWSLRAFHGHLFLAVGGHELLTFVGLLLLVSTGVGLWLWWPGLRNIGRALRWRSQASTSMNLHRQGGALIAVVLLLEAITGSYISGSVAIGEFIARTRPAAGHVEGPPVTRSLLEPRQDVDRVAAMAQTLVPEAAFASIFLPTHSDANWLVNFITASGPRTVVVNDLDGEAKLRPLSAPTTAERIEEVMTDLHFGRYGPAWQAIVFSSGLVMTLLSITGLLLWVQRRRRLAGRARPRGAP